MKLPNLI